MNFVTWSIRNPVPVIMMFVALVVGGIWAFPKLQVQDQPDISLPQRVRERGLRGRAALADGNRNHAQGRGRGLHHRRHRAHQLHHHHRHLADRHRVPVRHRPAAGHGRCARRGVAHPPRPAARRHRTLHRPRHHGRRRHHRFRCQRRQHERHRAVLVRRPERDARDQLRCRASARSTASAASRAKCASTSIRTAWPRWASPPATSPASWCARRWNCPAARPASVRRNRACARWAPSATCRNWPRCRIALGDGRSVRLDSIADVRDQAAEVAAGGAARRQAGDRLRGDACLGRRRAAGGRPHARGRRAAAEEISAASRSPRSTRRPSTSATASTAR